MVKSPGCLKHFPAFERLNVRPVNYNADSTQTITTGDLAVKVRENLRCDCEEDFCHRVEVFTSGGDGGAKRYADVIHKMFGFAGENILQAHVEFSPPKNIVATAGRRQRQMIGGMLTSVTMTKPRPYLTSVSLLEVEILDENIFRVDLSGLLSRLKFISCKVGNGQGRSNSDWTTALDLPYLNL
jgi:hypothetical protein